MPEWSFWFGQACILGFFEQPPFLAPSTTWKTTDFLLRNKSIPFRLYWGTGKTVNPRYSHGAFVPYQQPSSRLASESEVFPHGFNNTRK